VVFDVKNHYFAQMLNAIEKEAKARGYFVNITLHEKNRLKERELIQKLVDYRVDGLILSPVSRGKDFAQFLESLETPYVILGNKIAPEIPYIGIDEQAASREAVRCLKAAGYRHIVFVCPPLEDAHKENIYSHLQREKGFLEEINVSHQVTYSIIRTWDFESKALALLEASSQKPAFFCSGDIFAMDLMKVFRRNGKRAPRDYGIMGFDNIDILEYIEPKLTTIDNGVEKVAKTAVLTLLQIIGGEPVAANSIVPYTTIQGETI
jgi:LacI family transcriptional regulator